MRPILAFLFFFTILPALGATVTLSGTSTNSCAFASASSDRAGNIVYQCVAIVTPAPTPTEPTRQPTPPPAPTPTCGVPSSEFSPTSPGTGVRFPGLGPPSTALVLSGFGSTVYSAPLPKNLSGVHGSGFLQQTDHPNTPTELTMEWAIGKCPGDFAYYKSDAAAMPGPRGSAPTHPCGGINGAAGTTIRWSSAGSFFECRVNDPGPWYISLRFLNCVGSCSVAYYHTER